MTLVFFLKRKNNNKAHSIYISFKFVPWAQMVQKKLIHYHPYKNIKTSHINSSMCLLGQPSLCSLSQSSRYIGPTTLRCGSFKIHQHNVLLLFELSLRSSFYSKELMRQFNVDQQDNSMQIQFFIHFWDSSSTHLQESQ